MGPFGWWVLQLTRERSWSHNGLLIEQALKFAFKESNNQAKYEGLIGGMLLAKELGAQRLLVKNDSLLVTGQVIGEYQAKDP